MPHVNLDIQIPRAWRHRGESKRIHYVEVVNGGNQRHRYVDEGSRLYSLLDSHLKALGYTGPKSDPDLTKTAP